MSSHTYPVPGSGFAHRSRRRVVAFLVFTSAASMLIGYLVVGNRMSYAATGSDVTWRITNEAAQDRQNFGTAINELRNRVSLNNAVTSPSNQRIHVTDQTGALRFVTMDIHENGSRYVRLVVRSSDSFVVGFWAGGVDDAAPRTFFPLERDLVGQVPDSNAGNSDSRFEGRENYNDLQRLAGTNRVGMSVGPLSFASAVGTLQRADATERRPSDQEIGLAMLRMVVGIAESARFREQATEIANNMGRGQETVITERHADFHTNWFKFSEAAFEVLFGGAALVTLTILGAPLEITAATVAGFVLMAHHVNKFPRP